MRAARAYRPTRTAVSNLKGDPCRDPEYGLRKVKAICAKRSPMARRRQKIWITRAQPGAASTAERVRALGHEAIVAPLLAVRALEDVQVDLRGVAALAFTSANGVRAFSGLSAE